MQDQSESSLEPGYEMYGQDQQAGSLVAAEEGYEAYEGFEGEEYYQEGGLPADSRVGSILHSLTEERQGRPIS